jgi:stage IV sporulation protein B
LRLTLPDEFIISGAEELKIPSVFSLGHDFVPDLDAESYTVSLKLLDSIPVKNVQVQVAERRMVVPGGMPFALKCYTGA